MEAILYTIFFLLPVCFLGWTILLLGTAKTNTVAAARHAGFALSVEGVARQGSAGESPASALEGQVRQWITYFPDPGMNVLSWSSDESMITVKAQVRHQAPYKKVLHDRDRTLNTELKVERRLTDLFDQRAGKEHEQAIQDWEALKAAF